MSSFTPKGRETNSSKAGTRARVSLDDITEKTYELSSGKKVTGTLKRVDPKDFHKFRIHPENGRQQESLSMEAVSDIYDDIDALGVRMDLIGIVVEEGGETVFYILDGSRRFFVAKLTNRPFLIWVFPELDMLDAREIAEMTTKSKPLSWREKGLVKLKYIKDNGGNVEEMGLDACVSRIMELQSIDPKKYETTKREIRSALLPDAFIQMFVNGDDLPTKIYTTLGSIEHNLRSLEHDVNSFVDSIKFDFEKPVDPFKMENLEEDFASLDKSKVTELRKQYKEDLDKYNELVHKAFVVALKNLKSQPSTNVSAFERDFNVGSIKVKIEQKKEQSKVTINVSKMSKGQLARLEEFFLNLNDA
ncbi:hypothetical protein [Vibrio sp. SCSIO 43155]|uniref:hypothetical protein n=1 Tax=Vibrio TaxID=662 RepID=UPI0020760CA7|nr:hypothetical protein [Vibrio sp. SCSIO 43155]USD58558.1 hypothetical protein J4N44_26770 [Vibrio sp. SCSIO 43155]